VLTYPITRFLIEHLRNDEGAFFAGMTISQNISILIFVGGLVYWGWLRTLPERPRAEDSKESVPN
jgi:phosphatidylglycerol---prolipoprotein diacylglyceryl transferase